MKLPYPLLTLLLLTGCGASTIIKSPPATKGTQVADLQIVDCLLPGQVRRLGASTVMTPRRPTRTTAADCRIRGGEYVAYDRADYKTALNVWMAAAEAGDPEAQTNVGEIFERGHGGVPNYTAAAVWYRKAAEAGNTRAQYNLGTLYEQGLGVEKDSMKALNLYRQAWGMPEDDIIFQSAANRQQEAVQNQLRQKIQQQDAQITLLQQQVDQLQKQAATSASDSDLKAQLLQLQAWIADLQSQKASAEEDFAALPVFRKAHSAREIALTPDRPLTGRDKNFGRYFALVIGNQDYRSLDNLNSPRNDARRIAQLLESQYGFSVRVLLDASNVDVMQAVNDLNDQLGENDNLLIYYAGHGSRIRTGDIESGYWLPINADPPPTDTFWVANEFITRHLARLKAKRVLVVADSCYGGLLSNAPGYLLLGDQQNYTDAYLEYKMAKKARLLLASGSDKPVLDNAGAGHSVFARAFIEVLEENTEILGGPSLFVKLRERVKTRAQKMGVDQQPEFKAIKGAGHEVGDFFFVPLNS